LLPSQDGEHCSLGYEFGALQREPSLADQVQMILSKNPGRHPNHSLGNQAAAEADLQVPQDAQKQHRPHLFSHAC
jgi:hypothetical protein